MFRYITLVFLCSIVSCYNINEYNALSDLYLATNGKNWINTWNITDNDYCSYYGVICNSMNPDYSVYYINLNDNNLQGYLPTTINNLKYITYLDISNNKISGDISFLNLYYLQSLNINNNYFNGIIPYIGQTESRGIRLVARNNYYTQQVDVSSYYVMGIDLSSNNITKIVSSSAVNTNFLLNINTLQYFSCGYCRYNLTNNYGYYMNITTLQGSGSIYSSNINYIETQQTDFYSSNINYLTYLATPLNIYSSTVKDIDINVQNYYKGVQVNLNKTLINSINFISALGLLSIANTDINNIIMNYTTNMQTNITILSSKVNNITITTAIRFNNISILNSQITNSVFLNLCARSTILTVPNNNLTIDAATLIICKNVYLNISNNNIYGIVPVFGSCVNLQKTNVILDDYYVRTTIEDPDYNKCSSYMNNSININTVIMKSIYKGIVLI